MDDRRRFQEIINDIAADVRDGTRKRVPFLTAKDAALVAFGLQLEVDKQDIARTAHAEESEQTIACKLGCTACCENVVTVHGPEAVLAARWLRQAENDASRRRFLDAYPRWREQLGDDLDRFYELHAGDDGAAAEAFHDSLRRHHAMCAFNDEGACLIYPVRPNVCRYTMALDTSDYCDYENAAGQVPMGLSFPPLDDLVARTQPLLGEAHERMVGESVPVAMCDAVKKLLGGSNGSSAKGVA